MNSKYRRCATVLVAAVLAAGCGSDSDEPETGSGRPAGERPVVTAAPSDSAEPDAATATDPAPDADAATAAVPETDPAPETDPEPETDPPPTPTIPPGDGVAPSPGVVAGERLTPVDATEINCHWDLAQSRSFECFSVDVPADWSQPDGPLVQIIAAARPPDVDAFPALVVLAGGPGESILPVAREQNDAAYRQVFVAQRGGGWFDGNYDCYNSVGWVGWVDPVAGADSAEAAVIRDRLHTRCAELFTDTANVAAAGTAGHARDAAAVVAALGVDRWVVYGRGYGAATAAMLLNDPPAGLVGGILDGWRGPDWHPDSGTPLAAEAALEHLDGICNADPDCRTILAPTGARLAALTERLIGRYDTAPLHVEELGITAIDTDFDATVDGSRFAAMVVWMLATRTTRPSEPRAAMLPALLAGADSRTAIYEATIGLLAAEAQIAAVDDVSEAAYYLIACSEWLPAPAVALSGPFSDAAAGRGLATDCVPWVGHTVPTSATPSTLTTRLPVLALVGGLDPYTTSTAAEAAARRLPDVAVVEFASLGHGTWGVRNVCAQQIVAQFMRQLSTDVSTGCAAASTSLRWVTWP